MKLLPLSKGKFALVDDSEFEELSKFSWTAYRYYKETWYAYRNTYALGKRRILYMHRFLMGAKRGQRVDHRDRNGLNNQKLNLRFCTTSQNIANSVGRSASGFKGVYRFRNGWTSHITVNYKTLYLGVFDTVLEGAKAYNEAALKYFGEFARLNQLEHAS